MDAASVCRSLALVGKPGRYMSTEKGPRAANDPKIMISLMYLLLVIKKLRC